MGAYNTIEGSPMPAAYRNCSADLSYFVRALNTARLAAQLSNPLYKLAVLAPNNQGEACQRCCSGLL